MVFLATRQVETSEWIIDCDYNDPYKNPNQKYILGSRTVWMPSQIETVEVPQYGHYVVEKRRRHTSVQSAKQGRGAYFELGGGCGEIAVPTRAVLAQRKGRPTCRLPATWCADHPHKSLKPDQIRIFCKVLQGGGKPASRPKYTSQRGSSSFDEEELSSIPSAVQFELGSQN